MNEETSYILRIRVYAQHYKESIVATLSILLITISVFLVAGIGVVAVKLSSIQQKFIVHPESIWAERYLLDNVNLSAKIESSFSNGNYECNTGECLRMTAKISENMDRRVSPCEDFYQYACGGFINRNQYPQQEFYSVKYTIKESLKYDIWMKIKNELMKPVRKCNFKLMNKYGVLEEEILL
ncbi:DgyrCDS13092 [Dimorphilus gyrociliatus]|uniref:DgyrCDS13092 n=1 Tax=Dimorphilus gyrociliatus TaxID=2664684 RepID=A0A7I8W9Q0_9ANNE|nr:DgyrCDS13092 [Dimorphilus gyrociliatus]